MIKDCLFFKLLGINCQKNEIMKKIIRAVTASQSTCFYEGMIPDLQKKGFEVVSLSGSGPELKRLRNTGAKVIEIPMERHISILKDLKAFAKILNIFRMEKPDIVHSMTPKAGLLCMVAAWLTRVPKRVHTFTGLVWPTSTGLKRKILMVTDWITCACATHIIPEGEGVKNDLQQHITKKRMKVLGYGNVRGIDMVRFSKRPEVTDVSNTLKSNAIFTFLFVGRIVGDKGINELIEAFAKLNEKYKETRLILIGRYEDNLDPLKPETIKRIKEIVSIVTLGPKHGDELIAYYAASDCFVMPSYREGFPNTVIEAGAMGLPSIVTDINGSREIIKHDENGLIVPSKDANALYSAMERILLDQDATARMAEKARPMIESRFEQGFVRQCLFDFYDEILGDGKR